MYIIAPQFIREYLFQNFKDNGKLSANGCEFIMESLFVNNDWKKHMSINIDSGLWQCFKTGRSGNFTRLYSEVEGIPYFKAQRDLIIKNFEFLGEEVPELNRPGKQLELDTNRLTPITINTGNSDDPKKLHAWNFVWGRKLFNTDYEEAAPFYLCNEGKFEGRLIIPFKSDEVVYYFQGRALYDQSPKYLNPSTEIAPKPSDILYPYEEDMDHLVVCEGPLDARSLQLQGVNATATMKGYISPRQAEILSTFEGKIVLGYDNDEAGQRGIKRFDELRKEMRMESFSICSPPSKYNDWNEAHIANENLFQWVMENTTLYDFEYEISKLLNFD
jgi:5S rRNA maturation endonuclease (ribonuclease M5)